MIFKLSARHLTKIFGTHRAVSDVSLGFEPGQIHAVLGENGAGKSTLMKMFFGLHKPTAGQIFLNEKEVSWTDSMAAIRSGLGMVQQHFSLVGPLSAIDNIMLGAEKADFIGRLDRKGAITYLEKLLPSEKLSVPWFEKVENLTVGQKQRIEILKLLFRQAEVLFLDEPTAVLTPQEVGDFFEVLKKLKQAGKTIILITHKIHEVFALCDTYAILRQGRLIKQGRVAETTAADLVEGMIGRKLSQAEPARSSPQNSQVVSAQNLTERVRGRGSLKNISLNLHAGEIVGIAGVSGSGQSHFVDALMGLREVEGQLQVLGRNIETLSTQKIRGLGVGLVPEDRLEQALWSEQSCFENMVIGLDEEFRRGPFLDETKIRKETANWAKEFDVRASSLENPAGSLSGGNQQKLIFAREVIGRKPKVLICHEPTRGVDLGAIELIHNRIMELRNQGVGILLISSELDELMKLSDRLFVFFEGEVSGTFLREAFDRSQIGIAMTGGRSV